LYISVVQNGGSFRATILYNYTAVHSLPVATNLVTSARLRMAGIAAGISVYVWPWPELKMFEKYKTFVVGTMMVSIALAVVLVVPTFAAEIVRDRKVCYVFIVLSDECIINFVVFNY